MSLLELRELRYFLVIAEELHFGRAAQRLHIAQPALSKAIRAMEVKLAVTLLERTTRQARLTAAGEVLVRQARIVLEAAAAASNLTRRSADGALTVAAKASEAALARRLLDLHREAHPDLRVGEVSVCGWGEAIARLRMGVADVALLRDPPPLEGLDWEGLAQEPRLVALGASHRLARRRRLRLDELDAEPRATWPDADAQTTAFWQAR
ncbi:MAG: LysR family transcriptional regulator, partial [Solirubrobacteraceae bacterium]